MIVADAKDGGHDLPSWLEPDRAPSVAVLKVQAETRSQFKARQGVLCVRLQLP